MKHYSKIFFAALLSMASVKAFASGGPDSYGYTWTTSLDAGGPAYNWIDITSRAGVQTVSGLADDNSAASMINIGFPFHFYWNDYSQLKVGSNGWLSFNNVSNIASCFPTIPTAGNGDNLLSPLMGDLNFTGAGNPGQVKYWTNNNDSFIVSYINVPFWQVNAPGYIGSNSFQVILCSADSSIKFQYGSLSGFQANAACNDITVGIENSTGNIGLQVHSDAMPPNNYAILFDYPATVLLSIQDVLPRWNMSSDNAARFVLNNVGTTLTSDVRNGGNTAITTNITVQSNIRDAALTVVQGNTLVLPNLAAGDDTLITFSNVWTPTTAGQYTNETTVTNSQDINAGNNTLNTELEVVDPCLSAMALGYVTGNTPDGSLNWNGGANDDGAAVYFQPPVYPYTISALSFYISSNVGNNFIAQIYDDDGLNGGPGTLLFNTTVASASVVSSAWNNVVVNPGVTLNNGGYYVVWLQGGTNIFLGTETAGPRSHRNFEILDGAWATYRNDDSQDLLIRSAITGYNSNPTAAFSASATGQSATFSDNSTGLVTSWSWDFGDGSPVSTLQNPTHMYAAPGTYTVCLTAASPCSTNQVCQVVNICIAPSASYSSTASLLNASFTDLSAGTVTTWSWDFGDSQTSTQQNPTHAYAASGTYTVCMIAGNNCGDADTVCQVITVCDMPVPAFTVSQNEDSVFVTDQSTGLISGWSWDFGDGNFGTMPNDTNRYSTGGIYTICLTTTDLCGNVDSTCQNVMILITSIEDQSAMIASSYPNPAGEQLTITLNHAASNAQLQLFDHTGRMIRTENGLAGTSLNVDVHTLPAGIYWLRLEDANGSSVIRFVKE